MNQAETTRREEFIKYFESVLKGDRQKLIEAGISKGRASQYFDKSEAFGERAATALEDRLGVVRGTIFPSLVAIKKVGKQLGFLLLELQNLEIRKLTLWSWNTQLKMEMVVSCGQQMMLTPTL